MYCIGADSCISFDFNINFLHNYIYFRKLIIKMSVYFHPYTKLASYSLVEYTAYPHRIQHNTLQSVFSKSFTISCLSGLSTYQRTCQRPNRETLKRIVSLIWFRPSLFSSIHAYCIKSFTCFSILWHGTLYLRTYVQYW